MRTPPDDQPITINIIICFVFRILRNNDFGLSLYAYRGLLVHKELSAKIGLCDIYESPLLYNVYIYTCHTSAVDYTVDHIGKNIRE